MPVARQPRFRLRTILLIVNLFVLIIPLGSIYLFRIYENELVRQTESELIAQGAYISALYKQELLTLIKDRDDYGQSALIKQRSLDAKYEPINPILDSTKKGLSSQRPAALVSDLKADPLAVETGNKIFPVVQSAMLTTLAGVRIMDYQGIVIAGKDEVGMSLANVDEVGWALKGGYAANLRQRISKNAPPALSSISRDNGVRVFVAMPVIHNERVVAVILLSRSPRNILKGLYDDRYTVLVAGSIILGLTILLALLTSYAISRPIHALIGQAQRVARGEKDIAPIREPVTKELALLSENIATMAAVIEERSGYIHNFAMHVSHEFKTPLTAIQGAIELLQEHGDTMQPEQFKKFMGNITKDTDRLNKLVSRLLELARADVMPARQENVGFGQVIKDVQSYYQGSDLLINVAGVDDAVLPMPEDIARTVLGNLVENSRQHGASEVMISLEKDLSIKVEDNGRGISEANVDKLFTPFFTTKREQGGTGLGLVIVSSLLAAYGANIKCVYKPDGACFVIKFV